MKTMILSFKLFLKKPFSNAVLAIELALVALVMVVVGNVYHCSRNCMDAFANSGARLLYCSNPTPGLANVPKFQALLQSIDQKYEYVKGTASISGSEILFSDTDGAEILKYDDATITYLPLPISKGKWLGISWVDGKIPCVVGGRNAGRYKAGDTIAGYTTNDSQQDVPVELIVTGILTQPQQVLDLGQSTNAVLKASDLFKDATNRALFMIVPGGLYPGTTTAGSMTGSTMMYLDKACTPQQIEAVREKLNKDYTQLDTDMIAAEQEDLNQTLDGLLPFLLVLFVVIFTGLLSACLLTAIKNMQTFKVYYLVGCPRRKVLLLMLWYVLYYFIISGVLFVVLLQCGKKLVDRLAILNAFFVLIPKDLALIGAVCILVLLCSLLVPLVLIKKNRITDMLRKD